MSRKKSAFIAVAIFAAGIICGITIMQLASGIKDEKQDDKSFESSADNGNIENQGQDPGQGSGSVAEDNTETGAAYRNVLYYGEWSIYAGQKNFYPAKIDGSQVTHLNFAFIDMDSDGNLVLCDEHASVQAVLPEQTGLGYGEPYAGVLGAMCILRQKYPNMKLGISVGGWTRSGDFSVVAQDSLKRVNFAENISKFIDYLGFDFVDIDWEYPTAVRASDPEGNGVTIDEGCAGNEADPGNFLLLMQAIRDELDALGEKNGKYYELSAAMSASPAMMASLEYDKILGIVDFLNMMTYDLNGAWNGYTGHQTALYTNESYDQENQPDGQFSVDACISYLEDTYGDAIDYSKIVIGVAPYTRGWAQVQDDGRDKDNPGLYATAAQNSVISADGTKSGTFAYSEIDTLISRYGLEEYYDETAQAAYYYSAQTGYFFTCDNERSAAAKGEYVKKKGLGGLISWMASHDSSNSIIRAMKQSLYGDKDLPVTEIKLGNPQVKVSVEAEGSVYTITIRNEESIVESNAALRSAELFKKTVMNPVLYIETKSRTELLAGSECGVVTNGEECAAVDLSGVYNAGALKPGASHTFTLRASGAADAGDITGITLTQRILTSMEEFGIQKVYEKSMEESGIQKVYENIQDGKPVYDSPLPEHMVTGYWHNFINGSANLKLSDIPSYYDMICVAFTGNTSVAGEVTFELDADLCRALGGYTKEQFINDIKNLKKKGQHVIISVGGAEGRIDISSEAASQRFASSLTEIIDEYGFEGVDIDLEGSAVSGVNYIAGALRQVHDHFGENFIITMAPETYYIQADRLSAKDITTSYLRLALEIKDILTICYPQFYNSGSMNGYGKTIVSPGNADFIASLATLIIEAGLRPDQVALGVPSAASAAGSGYVSTDTVIKALNALVYGRSSGSFTVPKAYPQLRGVMTWSINWDAVNDYEWAKAMSAAIDEIDDRDMPTVTDEPDGIDMPAEDGGKDSTDDIPDWSASDVYTGGDKVLCNGQVYEAQWWTQGDNPVTQGEWGPWKKK